ncbi:hypothetical protein [Lysinibacillus sphaericus]|uniref:hypothetical protein n=1 Tax=Lysinibacillus sphaericus TaxID=1421 RepID=UPI003D7400EF
MTEKTYAISKESFVDQIIRKFQAYAIVDIENKINRLLRTETRDGILNEKISKLMDERNYYECASKVQLLVDLIESAKQRFEEEDMSYAKAAFDLVLSKRKFSSFH